MELEWVAGERKDVQKVGATLRLSEIAEKKTRNAARNLRTDVQRNAGKVDGLLETIFTHRSKRPNSTVFLSPTESGATAAEGPTNWNTVEQGLRAHSAELPCTAAGLAALREALTATGKQDNATVLKRRGCAHNALGGFVLIGGSGTACAAAADRDGGCAFFSSRNGGAITVFDSSGDAGGTWDRLWSAVPIGRANGVNLITNGKEWTDEKYAAKNMELHPVTTELLASERVLIRDCNGPGSNTANSQTASFGEIVSKGVAWNKESNEETVRSWLTKQLARTNDNTKDRKKRIERGRY
ncbi:hypothetical protein ERJ75_000340700 [Trypanosoma vivax]|nr:hypothetical protein ERJ75_000340700 [Trypanosoma vivax]